MAKRRRPLLTDPRLAGLEAVERETVDEAQILREIDASDADRTRPADDKKAAGRARKRKKT